MHEINVKNAISHILGPTSNNYDDKGRIFDFNCTYMKFKFSFR